MTKGHKLQPDLTNCVSRRWLITGDGRVFACYYSGHLEVRKLVGKNYKEKTD